MIFLHELNNYTSYSCYTKNPIFLNKLQLMIMYQVTLQQQTQNYKYNPSSMSLYCKDN